MGVMDDIVALVGAAKRLAVRSPEEVLDELAELLGMAEEKKGPKLEVVKAPSGPEANGDTTPAPAPTADKDAAPPANVRTLRAAT